MRLLHWNAFGIVRLSRNKVTASITAVQANGRPINRVFSEEFAEPIPLKEDLALSFGVDIQREGKTRTAIHEFNPIPGIYAADEYPQIGRAIAKGIELIRLAA